MEEVVYPTAERARLPAEPGVYLFYDERRLLLYVGKAKILRKRVASYFNRQKCHLLKTRKMVDRIHTIGFVLANSEYEALILENNLIKQHQPRYNVLLKDGKSYPYLCITRERFPRLITTRQRYPSLGTYFGPFTSTTQMERIAALIKDIYPLRTCKYNLSEENIRKGKFKVCLEYHLGNCLGPCEGLQSEKAYQEDIDQVVQLLKQNFTSVKKTVRQRMLVAAAVRNFKEAQAYKDKLGAIAKYQARSLVTDPKLGTLDVIAVVSQPMQVFVSYLYIQQGLVVFAQTVLMQKRLEEKTEDLLSLALVHFREKVNSQAKKVFSTEPLLSLSSDLVCSVPRQGPKYQLVQLAQKNAFFFQKDYLLQQEKRKTNQEGVLKELQRALVLDKLPRHIECFDNANLQGKYPVAGMVCFRNGRPAKKGYRYFHIKEVEGPNDYASMQEVVKRRYRGWCETPEHLPDLILIDGGKGQLNAVVTTLKKLGLMDKVRVIAIAKKLELVYAPGKTYPIHISKRSSALKLLQRIRNAAHEFALGFHRRSRQKDALASELESISGIGPKTSQKLLQHFGSLEAIRTATPAALEAVVGAHKKGVLVRFLASTEVS